MRPLKKYDLQYGGWNVRRVENPLLRLTPKVPLELPFLTWVILSHRDVDASADEEIKRIVTRGLAIRRRPTLVMAFWQQAELFPMQCSIVFSPSASWVEALRTRKGSGVRISSRADTLAELFGAAGDEADLSQATRAAATPYDATGIRILLVEDNEVNQQVATELLESAGASVRIAKHGEEAVRILTEGGQQPLFDIVFMDLQMPEMDGFTATRLLRALPQLRELPIIAMTAHALVEERQRCREAGMDDHASKPIEPDALFTTLMRWAKPRQELAGGSEGKPAKPADEIMLPQIDGVDVAGALNRVAGNKRLYRDLLVQFAARQTVMNSQILAAIDSGDNNLAERIVHTVKGVAGNIGLGRVFTAAEKLERAIREVDSAVPPLAEEFTEVASRQAQAIQHAIGDATSNRPADGTKSREFDAQSVSEAITYLRALLESSDGDAAESFVTLEGILAGICDKPRLSALSAAISEFDFDGARKKLDEIAKEYGANWEQSK